MVQKFGGTSLATAEKIHRAARRAIREAMGVHWLRAVTSGALRIAGGQVRRVLGRAAA